MKSHRLIRWTTVFATAYHSAICLAYSSSYHNYEKHKPEQISRRDSIRVMCGTVSGYGALIPCPHPATAASPVTADEVDSLGARWERFLRAPPSKSILRPQLNRDFSVLLMRSSYNAMDQLDCVPMDQFQRDFFLLRQAEYLPYIHELGPGLVKQGDLTDPYYFDFISFAQYATIFRDVSIQPAQIFQEQEAVLLDDSNTESPQQFVTRLVQRKPEWTDNKILPNVHDTLVGDAIFNYFTQVLGNTTSEIPPLGPHPSNTQILASLQQLANLFLIAGFAWDRYVQMIPNQNPAFTTVQVTFLHPATLWSGQALQLKRANPTNDFYRKTASAFLVRSGLTVLNWKVEYKDSAEITTITVA